MCLKYFSLFPPFYHCLQSRENVQVSQNTVFESEEVMLLVSLVHPNGIRRNYPVVSPLVLVSK